MRLLLSILFTVILISPVMAKVSSIDFSSETRDTLSLHLLKNNEIWASFMITDTVFAGFARHELIVIQIDKNQPIKLDKQKLCGTKKGKAQQVHYVVETSKQVREWQFSGVEKQAQPVLALAGWDKEHFQHMRSDWRPEVVDFPVRATIALPDLWSQLKRESALSFAIQLSQARSELQNLILNVSDNKWQPSATGNKVKIGLSDKAKPHYLNYQLTVTLA